MKNAGESGGKTIRIKETEKIQLFINIPVSIARKSSALMEIKTENTAVIAVI